MSLRFTLPFPPSLNHAYRDKTGGKGRVKSKALLAYREQCGKLVMTGIPRFTFHNGQRLKVAMECHAPDLRRYDLDNRIKAVLDSLQYSGVIENDSQVDEISMIRGEVDSNGGYVQIQVEERCLPNTRYSPTDSLDSPQ